MSYRKTADPGEHRERIDVSWLARVLRMVVRESCLRLHFRAIREMPDFNVVANVSDTIVTVVTDCLKALGTSRDTAPIAVLHDLHSLPVPPNNEAGIVAVTLVEIREDACSRNRPRTQTLHSGRIDSRKPPMALVLRYLLTPWSRDLLTTMSSEERRLEQRMLGRVAQRFYDGAILRGADLQGLGEPDPAEPGTLLGLKDSNEELKVKLAMLTFEEQTRFWHAVQQKYRPSLTYDVRVVNLDPIHEESDSLVSSREIHYGVLSR